MCRGIRPCYKKMIVVVFGVGSSRISESWLQRVVAEGFVPLRFVCRMGH